jgi:hypothetical protein
LCLERALVIASAVSFFRKPRLMEMDPLKTEETLHNYLRRHFERISKNKARQLVEQTVALEADVIPNTNKSLPVMDVEGLE